MQQAKCEWTAEHHRVGCSQLGAALTWHQFWGKLHEIVLAEVLVLWLALFCLYQAQALQTITNIQDVVITLLPGKRD